MGYPHNIISTFYTTTSEQKTRVCIHFNDPPGKLFRIIYSILVTSIFACITSNNEKMIIFSNNNTYSHVTLSQHLSPYFVSTWKHIIPVTT